MMDVFECGNGVGRRHCLWLREETWRGGAGCVHDRTLLELHPEGALCVEVKTIMSLTKLVGIGTARLADDAVASYGAREY